MQRLPCYWGEARPVSLHCFRKCFKASDARQISWATQQTKDLAQKLNAAKEQIEVIKAHLEKALHKAKNENESMMLL